MQKRKKPKKNVSVQANNNKQDEDRLSVHHHQDGGSGGGGIGDPFDFFSSRSFRRKGINGSEFRYFQAELRRADTAGGNLFLSFSLCRYCVCVCVSSAAKARHSNGSKEH